MHRDLSLACDEREEKKAHTSMPSFANLSPCAPLCLPIASTVSSSPCAGMLRTKSGQPRSLAAVCRFALTDRRTSPKLLSGVSQLMVITFGPPVAAWAGVLSMQTGFG